jgi:tRNA threonylcarbamoyladenosine biosynthesis protein TsaE
MAAPRTCTDPLRLDLPDPAATAALAARLAALALRGDVIALGGDLGSGKTSFARAFINALPRAEDTPAGEAEEVPSPTFTLVQTYRRRPADVWHFDLYRLTRPEEAYELGIEEAFAEAISLIEWPERLEGLLPTDRLNLVLHFADRPEARWAELCGRGVWAERLEKSGLQARAVGRKPDHG